jgi:hypothetical protein
MSCRLAVLIVMRGESELRQGNKYIRCVNSTDRKVFKIVWNLGKVVNCSKL